VSSIWSVGVGEWNATSEWNSATAWE
jgi:hypothetical protein